MLKKHFVALISFAAIISALLFYSHIHMSEPVAKVTQEQPAPIVVENSDQNIERFKDCECQYDVIPDVAESSLTAVVTVVTQIIDKKQGPRGFDRPLMFPPSPFGDLFKEFFDFDRPKKIESQGSGFIIREPDGKFYIVTNYHVVTDATEITIILSNKSKFKAELLAHDSKSDLAVLKVNDPQFYQKNKAYLEWGDSKKTRIGQRVIAIGNPFRLGSTVTEGIISFKGRDIPAHPSQSGYASYMANLIQHTASINPGSSGGVLLSIEKDTKTGKWVGKVIGINTAIFSPSGGGNVGVGFAIESDTAKSIISQLLKVGKAIYGWLGVMIAPFDEDQRESLGITQPGFYVDDVMENSPASKAGVKPDDFIIEYDGRKIDEDVKLTDLVEKTPIGKVVNIVVLRGDKTLTLKTKIEERKEETLDKQSPQKDGEEKLEGVNVLGLRITQIPEGICKREDKDCQGVFVSEVLDANTVIDLDPGDIIQKVNRDPVDTPQGFKSAIDKARKNKRITVLLKVKRKVPYKNRYPVVDITEDKEPVQKPKKRPRL